MVDWAICLDDKLYAITGKEKNIPLHLSGIFALEDDGYLILLNVIISLKCQFLHAFVHDFMTLALSSDTVSVHVKAFTQYIQCLRTPPGLRVKEDQRTLFVTYIEILM